MAESFVKHRYWGWGEVQENVPLKTPEVTEQLELACIATCLLPVYCKL